MNYNKFFSNYIQEINDLLTKIDTKLINQTIENTTTRFDPMILQIESIDTIQRFTNWISGLAQNVIVRKVDFVNQKNGQNLKAVFHIAIYDDSFQS